MISVNAYTAGILAPSSRYRVRQLIPILKENDVVVNEYISRAGAFPPIDKKKRLGWAVSNVLENALKVLNQKRADVSLIQKPMLSRHSTFEGLFRGPRVFDVDDAIFFNDGDGFSKSIASKMQKIICGNQFLANRFSNWNNNVEVIATAVDVSKFNEYAENKSDDKCILLWTGIGAGLPFIYNIEAALHKVLIKHADARLRIVSDVYPQFKIIKEHQFEFLKWTPEIEFSSVKSSSIGLMPIADTEHSRGKCSFKMLCYMAAKLPVVVSPFGMNKEVLDMGELGFGPTSNDEWYDALDMLIASRGLQNKLAENGYRVVNENFDINIIGKKLANSLKNI